MSTYHLLTTLSDIEGLKLRTLINGMLSGLTTCSSQAVDLVKKMLVFDPSKRITVSQMLVLTQLALSLLFNAE